MLEIEFPLRNRLWRDDMTGDVTLKDVGDTQFDIVGMLSHHGIRAVAGHVDLCAFFFPEGGVDSPLINIH